MNLVSLIRRLGVGPCAQQWDGAADVLGPGAAEETVFEMDTPHALIERDNGVFSSLVKDTGSKSAKELRARAGKQFESS
eukprot:805360-Prorocentrum_minimum.AAC.2